MYSLAAMAMTTPQISFVQWRTISVLHVPYALKNDFLPSTAKENRIMPTYNVSKQQYIFYDVFMSTALLSVQS